MNIEQILARYTAGYCPYPDPSRDALLWDRKEVRAMIPLNEETAARATRLLRTIRPPYVLQHNHAVESILAHLSDQQFRPATWVRGPILTVYRILEKHGFLRTIEATENGKLVGGVLAIDLPGVLIIESMFSLASNSSKQCACQAVLDYHERGYAFIDVENPHRTMHPLARLGEKVFSLAEYQHLFRESVEEFSKRSAVEPGEQLRLVSRSFA
jgi:leucyl/phenylalanyl-tRNA--protein transferase